MEIKDSFPGLVEVDADVLEKYQGRYEEGAALTLPPINLKPSKGE